MIKTAGVKRVKITDPQHNESNEALALRWLHHGDREAFNQLFERNKNFAYRSAYGFMGRSNLAQEAVQEAFCIVMRRGKHHAVGNPGSFRAWLYGIIKNVTFNLSRTEKRKLALTKRPKYQERLQGTINLQQKEADASKADAQETRIQLQNALAELPADYRLPILLHYVEGMNLQQTGNYIGITRRVLERRLEKGLSRLRHQMEKVSVVFSAAWLTQMLQEDPAMQAPTELQEAFASGDIPPISLHFDADGQSQLAGTFSLGLLPFIFIGIVTTTAVIAVFNSNDSAPSQPITPNEIMPTKTDDSKKPIAHWTFENGEPEGFEPVRFNWEWRKTGEMVSGDNAYILFPELNLPDKFTVTLKARPSNPDMIHVNEDGNWSSSHLYWVGDSNLQPFSMWTRMDFQEFHPDELTIHIHFQDNHIVQQVNDQFESVISYAFPISQERLLLQVSFLAISEITIHQHQSPELQQKWNNMETLKQSLSSSARKLRTIPILPVLHKNELKTPAENSPLKLNLSNVSMGGLKVFKGIQEEIHWDKQENALRVENLSTMLTPFDVSRKPFLVVLTVKKIDKSIPSNCGIFPSMDRMYLYSNNDQQNFYRVKDHRVSLLPPTEPDSKQFLIFILNDSTIIISSKKWSQTSNSETQNAHRLALEISNYFIQSLEARVPTEKEIKWARSIPTKNLEDFKKPH